MAASPVYRWPSTDFPPRPGTLGKQNYDVNRDATQQKMRSYVCGQCHVEYYFKGTEKRLTYPWHKGLKADEILSYYEEVASPTGCTPNRAPGR